MNYYNENDKFAAAWLRELIKDGLIPNGEVDERSIAQVAGTDTRGFTQCHFFAGIGGWSYALRLAGWPDDRPVWTGSCPCQPFSAAGKRKGVEDERHLWPEFRRLIAECNPPTVFGEQVASKDGRLWLAGVRTDLEALGNAVGAADLCVAGVGAPHIRQRLFWVAYADGGFTRNGDIQPGGQHGQQPENGSASARLEHAASDGRKQWGTEPSGRSPIKGRPSNRLGDTYCAAEERQQSVSISVESEQGTRRCGHAAPWAQSILIECADGKARRIEPSIQPLAHGVPSRVGTLRGAGNAINPWLAAEFVKSYLDTGLISPQPPHSS